MKYLKIFTDFAKQIEALNDTEVGRLFRAMLTYAETGEVTDLKGNERFLWGTAKMNIDNQIESYEDLCIRNKKIANSRNVTTRHAALPLATTNYELCEDKEKDKEKDKEIYKQVVSYLNEKAGTAYRASSSKTQTYIHARIADGFALDDFKTVIDKKCAEWLGTDMEQYLRPETLFGTKFESYLNAKIQKKSEKKFITAAEYKGAVNTDDIDALFEEI